MLNRYATLTSAPTVVSPACSRSPPTSSTASVPNVGSASMIGSNRPRSRPTRIIASRSSSERCRNRPVSLSSRPRVFTTRAPSKLSCAISLTSARSCWARVIRGAIRREYMKFTVKIAGNTTNPTMASTGSVRISATAVMTSMISVPQANGSGAIVYQLASTSAFALDSSVPVGCCWCQDSGSRRYCRVTRRRYAACSRYCTIPAPTRRPMIPTTLRIATPRMSAAAPASAPAVVSPLLERRHDHLRGDPAQHERAGDGHRAVQRAPDHREGEDPPLLADADPQNT